MKLLPDEEIVGEGCDIIKDFLISYFESVVRNILKTLVFGRSEL